MRVVVVDDSAVARGAVSRLVGAEPDLAVVATASTGAHALEALARHAADVVVLDVEMPGMDGLTALPLILRQHPGVRVLMLSAHGGRGAEVTVRALALGAADFVCKPRAGDGAAGAPGGAGRATSREVLDAHAAELTRKIRALGRSAQRVAERLAERAAQRAPAAAPAPPTTATRPTAPPAGPAVPARAAGTAGAPAGVAPVAGRAPTSAPNAPAAVRPAASTPNGSSSGAAGPALLRARPFDVLAIASSTGGPVALTDLLTRLRRRLTVPVLVTQHMPPEFTRLLAERLTAASGLPCAEARDGQAIEPGHVYVAPGDHHLVVERRLHEVRLRLTKDPPVNHCRPAADPMFASLAAAYGAGVLAVVLTGMGHDGRDGAAAIVGRGGRVLAQDEATSVVWGMPGAVAQAGLAEAVQPVPELAAHVVACCAARPGGRASAHFPRSLS